MKTVHTSGKRKESIARATLHEGKGVIRVNSQLITCYEPKMHRMRILEPLLLAGEVSKKVDITVTVTGGGVSSQADAVRLAIARALVEYTKDAKLESQFLDYDRHLLVADVRRKEVNKPNRSKARAKRQKSYR
jgi:small subunit ribosomal protein S9